jgi:D-lactate dehydrogenase
MATPLRPHDPVLVADLGRLLAPERVLFRPIDRLGRSADASLYRLVPEAVVRPRDLSEVRALLAYAGRRRRHLTFRAAGTSLSGQAVSDDLLVELAPHWRGVRVLDGGRRIWAQPGVVGGHLNRLLAPHRTRIGPDPASIDACMIGGIVANNSSGMCCGVVQNSYHTLDSLAVLLADGTLVDTARGDADERLRHDRPDLHAALQALRDDVRGDAALSEKIRRKFRTKNTTGYSLNAFLDHERPADILAHLMVGSEGTLGFLAEVTLRTVPEPPFRSTALLHFAGLEEAGDAVFPLAEAGAAALEILDASSLRAIEGEHPLPYAVERRSAAILAEFRTEDEDALRAGVASAEEILKGFRLRDAPGFTTDAAERAHLWHLRKGLVASTGARRPTGTALISEDVAVPVERLAAAITDFQDLFVEHGLTDAVLFGHAKDGNLHFVLAEDIRSPEAVGRFDRFLRGLVDVVVGKYDGALKAEHGSGRNMAPFVRTEWGDRAYEVMWRIKRLLDPGGIFNPGVVLNDDPEAHIKHMKPSPTISPLADRCIECGFCEGRCPSRDLTLTPRQRIVVTREQARLGASDDPAERAWAKALAADFEYEGVATCAGDSMCQTSCPVKIDTGALMKELKAAAHPAWSKAVARQVARHFGLTALAARGGLRAAWLLRSVPLGGRVLDLLTDALHRLAPSLVPHVPPGLALPRPAPRLPPAADAIGARAVVYFPTCLTRILGPEPGQTMVPPARAALESLRWAGFTVRYPDGLRGLCCGMPFASKAFSEAARAAAARTAEALWRASREGRDPVVTDASPCAGTLNDLALAFLRESGRTLRVFDFASFWAREVLPGLPTPPRRPGTAVLHPTCSLVKAGGLGDLLTVATAHAERVVVPRSAECCGFAGDRGFLVPELTESATRAEAAEVRGLPEGSDTSLYSTCRTCEIGMTRAVGRPYLSVLHLVHRAITGA